MVTIEDQIDHLKSALNVVRCFSANQIGTNSTPHASDFHLPDEGGPLFESWCS